MENYEKLGAFYLGREYDLAKREQKERLLLYDSKDLCTHAVCVGMTGSGKTGLCISLLEEAAIDGIPALIIDPKGDLGNLMLNFPGLQPGDFRPWINEDDARRKEMSPDEFAAKQAELWRTGLASWGQTGERIQRLQDAAEFTIYTPGSTAGVPVSILSSFAAPPAEVRSDGDLLQERVSSTATGLLGLLGVNADPIRSREHILLSTILSHFWHRSQDLTLERLILSIQTPPVERVGVLDLESFYPSKDRFQLSMQLNNLLAAPSFQNWMSGEPLDVDKLLYGPGGKPRMAILSIAHLSEAERMFFVSLLLNQMLGWMRTRPGTTSLRALLYMDEIFGYMPPIGEPPSKRPLLTMLKQARAYGVGVVLATQNPVDLDYKGLSNTGTWFLGRLQTERDKMRVLEGLEGAAGGSGFDRGTMEEILAGLGKRVFLMHNVHEREPVIFHTRWAMSYLRGPLTRQQIKQLMQDRKTPPEEQTTAAQAKPAAQAEASRPLLAPDVPQVFLPHRDATRDVVYEPSLIGVGQVQFVDRGTKAVKHEEEIVLLQDLDDNIMSLDWERAEALALDSSDLESDPRDDASFAAVPKQAGSGKNYVKWRKAFADTLYRTRSFDMYKSPTFREISNPGESERDFRIRLSDMAHKRRDIEIEKLRKKYAIKIERVEERVRKAGLKVDKEKEQVSSQKMNTAISFGTTLLSAFLGRKKLSLGTLGRATTAARGVSRTAKESQDVGRAQADLEALEEKLAALNEELEDEIGELEDRFDPMSEELQTVSLRPRRADVEVRLVALAWAPYGKAPGGTRVPLS